MSVHTPIIGNPMFLLGREHLSGRQTWDWICSSGCFTRALSNLRPSLYYGVPPGHFFSFHQVSRYWKTCSRYPHCLFGRSFLDPLVSERHFTILAIYKRLQMLHGRTLEHTNVSNWGKDFPTEGIIEKLVQSHNKIRRLICNE